MSSAITCFISDVVDQLDLSVISARCQGEERGGPSYHPRMMVKVLLYGYCTGVASFRRMAQRLHEDIAFRVLADNNTLDFRTISDFHKDYLSALGELFHRIVPSGAGLVLGGGAGEAGPCRSGQHQGEGQRVEAQGHELGEHVRRRRPSYRPRRWTRMTTAATAGTSGVMS